LRQIKKTEAESFLKIKSNRAITGKAKGNQGRLSYEANMRTKAEKFFSENA